MLRRPNREYGTRCFRDYFFGGRSPQCPRKSATAVRHHRDQVYIIVAHCICDFMSRLSLNDHRFDFQAIEKLIREQVFDLTSQLQQPMRFLIFEKALR